ncbi:hypothetical protein L195_g053846 [Trifolium pratense]|uniref:Uncharacterized protein n=1 Tax=Trifolium pratense TaxID=57577 RepID=A0A2K3KCR7_TRIPR|nr:hypothetical protein L195_g053846 [Trifolium pratense]
MKNQSYSQAESILRVDDDSFFSKVQKSHSSIGQCSGRYFSDEKSVIPFKWEEEPGIPKEELGIPKKLEPSPTKIVPPPKLKPKNVTEHVSTNSCLYVKPIWLRSSKDENDDEDIEEESFDQINCTFEKDEFFSSYRASKSFSGSSTSSSKGTVLKSSKSVTDFAKGIYNRVFH